MVGFPHDIKGEGIVCYVVLKYVCKHFFSVFFFKNIFLMNLYSEGVEPSDKLTGYDNVA